MKTHEEKMTEQQLETILQVMTVANTTIELKIFPDEHYENTIIDFQFSTKNLTNLHEMHPITLVMAVLQQMVIEQNRLDRAKKNN